MPKYRVDFIDSDGNVEEGDELFDTEEAAEDHGAYMRSCYREGAEILHMSNPGDYPEFDEDDTPDFEVVEVDDK